MGEFHLHLVIGLLGLKVPALVIHRKAPVQEEAVPTVIEPLVTAVQKVNADAAPPEAASQRSSEEGGPVVAVTKDSPSVAFAVPTVGNLLVPVSMAQAPPAHPMQGAVVITTARIQQIAPTGVGGSRPGPTYPHESWLNKEQGTVVLRIEVDASGKVLSVTIKEPSGYARLDKAAAEHVRRYWLFEAAQGKRIYECPFIFKLQ